jgi:crossover junction endodeoxyribonuclease RusA
VSVVLVLGYPVSANRYWRSFVPYGARRAVTTLSVAAKQYKQHVQVACLRAGLKPQEGPVWVDIKLYPKRPGEWADRARKDPDGWEYSVRCIDLDNARKVLNDSLKNLAFADDKWIRRDSGEIMKPDEHGARLVVTITPIIKQRIAPELAL